MGVISDKSNVAAEKVERAVEKIKAIGGSRVRFIILYGSASEDRMRASSDIDISVYYDDEDEAASDFRLQVLSELFDERYDIKIFQQMPVYARIEALKGKVLYCDDRRFMYNKAYETIKEFDSFTRIYYDYIGAEPIK